MSARDARERLDRLVAELRAQPPPAPRSEPSPHWRAEFRRAAAAGWPAAVAASSALPQLPPRRAWSPWLPGLAAAAVLGWASAFVAGRWVDAPLSHREPPAASVVAVLEGAPLELGTGVTALEQPRRVEHPGRASWVLAPGSRGRVLSADSGVLRVALERGSLDAEVQPSGSRPTRGQSPVESFIVVAQGTEVAVHGTRFRVTLSGEHTRVEVSQGQVVVRPLGQLEGTTLAAGMSAEFRAGVVEAPLPAAPEIAPTAPPEVAAPSPSPSPPADGAAAAPAQRRGSLRLGRAARPTEAGSAASAASAPGAAGSSRSEPLSAPLPSASSTPPAAIVEPALRAITERVQSCFRRHTPGPSDLGIEVSTELVFWVEASGELLQADFEPPLAPAVEACVAVELGALRLAPSPAGYRVQREIRLHR